ncbi:MAG: tyrosine-type recombinase/integrase [Eggerthellaceae bacterium]|nr:tyrosine-type recombinase/integrase [Eggerthellaceae bacterium]
MGDLDFADGPYRSYLGLFVRYKRGKGEQGGRNLLSACKKISVGLADEPDASGLDERAVRALLAPLEGESDTAREYRVSVMRQFCAFLNTLGVPCWKVPARYFTAPKPEFRPYIFSDGEVSALLAAADSLLPFKRRAKGGEVVYPVLVRLLLSSGLRISEALALEVDDFDAESGVLDVVNSKNGVSRAVPLGDGMSSRLVCYVRGLERGAGPLFMSPYTGRAYSGDGVRYMFEKLYDAAGIRTEAGRRPRVHDCRHWFCTRSLDKMLASGMSVYEAVPILAAYVGHVNYADTEKYIHLTRTDHAEFLAMEADLGSLIPKAVV